jgi:hypothetical protein
VELEPPTNAWKPLGSQQLMAAPPDDPEDEACPCGEEPIGALFGQHVVGVKCRAQIEGAVRHRFGAHRYRGRFSQAVEDVVQECYVKLVRPGGLDSFRPQPGKPRADSFRAWLSGVVRNHCNNKGDHIRSHPDLDADPVDGIPEPMHAKTPAAAFAEEALRDLARGAVADVEARWRQKGAVSSERFDVFLPFVLERDDDYGRAQRRLAIKYDHARKLKFTLDGEIRRAARARVRDELFLEPGLSPAEIEAMIDQAIDELLCDAFPGGEGRALGFLKAEPEPELEPEQNDAPPESKP